MPVCIPFPQTDILDWHGDHLFTNYHDLFNSLRAAGFYVEVLSSSYTCFDARNYGGLLLVDSEEEFYKEEIDKLEKDIKEHGLAVFVFAEW
jgi:membrane-bound transcription factor site-1 protease